MHRRRFLRASAVAAAGLAAPGLGSSLRAAPFGRLNPRSPSRLDPVGLQLYTVRWLMDESVERTLELVARIGYREVELAGLFGRSPGEFRGMLDDLGLSAPATHHGIDVFRDGFEEAADVAATLGHEYLVLPSLPRASLASLDAVRRTADEMNAFGERCRSAGLRFAFHNHAAELRMTDGDVPLLVFLERTDPELVTFEVDLFWMVHGDGDPLQYFDAYPGRFELCHIKDRTADGDMVDVGEGVIDFEAILADATRVGLRHFFVEHDSPDDPAESITNSFGHAAALTISD